MSGARADELIKELFGEPNAEGDRRVEILHAHTAALAWVREATGRYPAPRHIAERLAETADKLKHDAAAGNPHEILIQVAVRSLSGEDTSAA